MKDMIWFAIVIILFMAIFKLGPAAVDRAERWLKSDLPPATTVDAGALDR